MNDTERALQILSDALHSQARMKKPLLETVWYALEIADHVLEGKTIDEALEHFSDPNSDIPERWKETLVRKF